MFNPARLNLVLEPVGGEGMRWFNYPTDDSEDTVLGAGYFTDAEKRGLRLYDLVFVSPEDASVEPYVLTIDEIDASGHATAVNAARFGASTLSYKDRAAVEGARIPAPIINIVVDAYSSDSPSMGRANYRSATLAEYNATTARLRIQDAGGRKWIINEPIIHVAMAGAVGDGVTDDTAAINACFAYVRASTTTPQTGRKYYVTGAGMMCRIEGSVNATLIRPFHNWGVRDLFIDAHCTGKVALDFTGSRYGHFENIYVWGDQTDTPYTGMQIARWETGGAEPASGEHIFTNCVTDGYFTKSGHHNYGCEGNLYNQCSFWNKQSGEYALIMDGDGAETPISDFTTLATGFNSFMENLFIGSQACQLTSGPAIYLGNTDEIEFINSYAISMDDVAIDAVFTSRRTYQWKLGIHVEATPNLIAFMRMKATAASVEIAHLTYEDHSPNTNSCLFLVDSSVTVAKIFGFKLDIGNWMGGVDQPNKVFDTPSKIHLHDCDAMVPTLSGFNTMDSFAAFSGHVYGRDQTERMQRAVTYYNDSGVANAETARAVVDFYRSGADTNSDGLHNLRFYGKNASGTKTKYAAILPSISSTTAGAENGVLSFGVASAGAFTAQMTIAPTLITLGQPTQFASKTVSTLPSAANHVRSMVFVSNESGGPTLAYSDGTNWRRVYDNAIVS